MMLLVSSALLLSPHVEERIDPITSKTSVFALYRDGGTRLALGCDDTSDRKTIRILIRFNFYVGDAVPGRIAGGRDIIYRFDERPPVEARWYSHDNEITAEAGRTDPLRFLREMKASTILRVRAFDPDQRPVDASFSYFDPTSTIESVLVRCGYRPDGTIPKRSRK
jgi:hypothetical protein